MRVAVALLVALVLVGHPTAQVPAGQQKPAFRAGVNFVRVDAYPTVKGVPVADLEKEEFEVLEDGVPQRIETFETIVTRPPGPEAERVEPGTVAESNEAAADPHNRLFVLYLDSYHTSVDGTTTSVNSGLAPGSARYSNARQDSRIGNALARFLQRTIGPDDLIGLLRPEMPTSALTFTRRPSSFESFLETAGAWQRRFQGTALDDFEERWQACYHETAASEMIDRHREEVVFDSLHHLVERLDALRDGRKLVLIVSEGWQLFRPATTSGIPAGGGAVTPQPPTVGVGRGGLSIGGTGMDIISTCEADRLTLAGLDTARMFRNLMDDANRANVSFYTIDPRGLAAPGLFEGVDSLREHLDALRTLAGATDGLAIIDSNNLDKNLQRIQADTSRYYLLGYASTNSKFDGKFRKITVRVKRPGVDVRARRGYVAMTDAEAATRSASAPVDLGSTARGAALAVLDRQAPERALRLAAGWSPAGGPGATQKPSLWVVAELDLAAARQAEWADGASATVTAAATDGHIVGSGTATLAPGSRMALVPLPDVEPGDYQVRTRLLAHQGSTADVTEHVAVTVPVGAAHAPGDPTVFRRGPYTGPTFQPTADVRFRKAERLRVQVMLGGVPDSLSAQVVDRKGQPLAIPVTTADGREAAPGTASAELALAPLAPGDYLLEITIKMDGKPERVFVPFRVVPS